EGYPVIPNITIPDDATDITITSDGTVNVKLAGRDDSQQIGQLELARFSNPGGLNSEGRNLYEETVASGPAMEGTPGSEGFGTISQGFLEKSNVEVVEEMANMIGAQRAYEVNSKSIQAADEMLQTANQLRR
ncbi:MAG: flagellar hook-basal body complex protein, partial [Bacillota bacterium]